MQTQILKDFTEAVSGMEVFEVKHMTAQEEYDEKKADRIRLKGLIAEVQRKKYLAEEAHNFGEAAAHGLVIAQYEAEWRVARGLPAKRAKTRKYKR